MALVPPLACLGVAWAGCLVALAWEVDPVACLEWAVVVCPVWMAQEVPPAECQTYLPCPVWAATQEGCLVLVPLVRRLSKACMLCCVAAPLPLRLTRLLLCTDLTGGLNLTPSLCLSQAVANSARSTPTLVVTAHLPTATVEVVGCLEETMARPGAHHLRMMMSAWSIVSLVTIRMPKVT